jgi:hypothetical protein
VSKRQRVSSPRIDQQWAYKGGCPDWRNDPPWRRKREEIAAFLHRPYRAGHVLLPHAVPRSSLLR